MLTEREREVLRLIAVGLSNREIGERLDLTTETVKRYNERLCAKLNVENRAAAVRRARELRVLESDSVDESAFRFNLPAPLTTFFGRERELEAIGQLLHQRRLVTLTGMGGTGKTRLALEVARRVLPSFPQGATFVPLASVEDPDLVVETIATTLGVKEEPGENRVHTLKRALAGERVLLVVDNFEHLLSAAPAVTRLLESAPGLVVLATSREPLQLYGEQVFPVGALEVDLASSDNSPAVQLFVDRVQSANPNFQLQPENISYVVQICTVLDGLPLAIELVASYSRFFSPAALLSRLKGVVSNSSSASALDLLGAGPRDRLVRQQTMRATIDWSYHLLTPEEQALFRRLAVFAAGCTVESVSAVCWSEEEQVEDIIELLYALANKSLLQVEQGTDGRTRLSMLHVIREYARDKMERLGESHALHLRHARYFLALAEEAEPRLREPQQERWLEQLEIEHGNILAALQWSLGDAHVAIGLRLAAALPWFWYVRGHAAQGRKWLEESLAQLGHDDPSSLRARLCYGAGILAWAQGDYEAAHTRFEQGLESAGDTRDLKLAARMLNNLGSIAYYQSDNTAARAYYEQALAVAEEQENKAGMTSALLNLGVLAGEQGQYDAARSFCERCLALAEEIGDRRRIAIALDNLANIRHHQGEQALARPYAERSLTLAEELDYKHGIAKALNTLAGIAAHQGKLTEARSICERSLALAEAIGDKQRVVTALGTLGVIAESEGDKKARSFYRRSLSLAQELGIKRDVVIRLCDLAALQATEGGLVQAIRLWGVAEGLREELGLNIPPMDVERYERALAYARAGLGVEAYAAAIDEGKRMALDEAVAVASIVPGPSVEQAAKPSADRSTMAAQTWDRHLTHREIEVLRLVAEGLTDAEVAQTLTISPRTVNAHLSTIYRKLDVNSRTAATRVALDKGWV